MIRFVSGALFFLLSCSAFSFPSGTRLPLPPLVSAGKFSLKSYELPTDAKILVFFYSASWCAPCKPIGDALTQMYPDLMAETKGLEIVTYSVDFSPRARAEYLRKSRFDWPGISPEVSEKAPWLNEIPGGTPQLQAFRVTADGLVALTEPGDPETILREALRALE